MSLWWDLIQSADISSQRDSIEELTEKVEYLQQVVSVQQQWIEYLNKRLNGLGDDGK